ncbi:MAG: DoxX family protein [Hyphomicrobiales bacterium]
MAKGEAKLMYPGLANFYKTWSPIAYTLVRVFVGIIMIMHVMPKLNNGPAAVAGAFSKNYGLEPAIFFAYGAIFLEAVGGAALILGLFTRFFAAALAVEMLIAMFAAHWAKGFMASQGGYEFVALLGFVLFAIALRGGGPYSVDRQIGKEL